MIHALLLIVAGVFFFIAMGVGFSWWDSDYYPGFVAAGFLAWVLASLVPLLVGEVARRENKP
jgi:hypothetical protein